MVETVDIELRSYSNGAIGSLVFNRIWQLRTTDSPIAFNVSEAYFIVLDENGKKRLTLSLGDGLTWDSTDKSFLIQITNEQVQFIKTDRTLEYAFYVVSENNALIPIREGAVNALRVA